MLSDLLLLDYFWTREKPGVENSMFCVYSWDSLHTHINDLLCSLLLMACSGSCMPADHHLRSSSKAAGFQTSLIRKFFTIAISWTSHSPAERGRSRVPEFPPTLPQETAVCSHYGMQALTWLGQSTFKPKELPRKEPEVVALLPDLRFTVQVWKLKGQMAKSKAKSESFLGGFSPFTISLPTL